MTWRQGLAWLCVVVILGAPLLGLVVRRLDLKRLTRTERLLMDLKQKIDRIYAAMFGD